MNDTTTHMSYFEQFMALRSNGGERIRKKKSGSYKEHFLAGADRTYDHHAGEQEQESRRQQERLRQQYMSREQERPLEHARLREQEGPREEARSREQEERIFERRSQETPSKTEAPADRERTLSADEPLKDSRLKWETNSLRFAEEELPALSRTSVSQLESNFRELMIAESNISALGMKGNTLYITSCSDKAGKTISSISMAYALSFYAGKEVLLIDNNHHSPQIHNLFGIERTPGFYDFCRGTAASEDVVLPTIHRGISIVTIGSAEEYIATEKEVEKALASLSPHFDYVLCDGGSVMSSSMALRNIKCFSGVLIVIECEKTRWEVLQVAEDKIKKSGGPDSSIGVICNRRKYYIPSAVYRMVSKN